MKLYLNKIHGRLWKPIMTETRTLLHSEQRCSNSKVTRSQGLAVCFDQAALLAPRQGLWPSHWCKSLACIVANQQSRFMVGFQRCPKVYLVVWAVLFVGGFPLSGGLGFLANDGTLNYQIKVGEVDFGKNASRVVKLSHEIEYDPNFETSSSSWKISFLESWLVRGSEAGFLWKPQWAEKATRVPEGDSSGFNEITEGVYFVETEGDDFHKLRGAEDDCTYAYRKGQLVGIQYGDRIFKVRSEAGYIREVQELIEGRWLLRVKAKYNIIGQVEALRIGSLVSSYKYNSKGQVKKLVLTYINTSDSTEFEFIYKNDLITKINLNTEVSQRFEWCIPDDFQETGFYQPDYLAKVRLCEDQNYKYRSGITRKGMHLVRIDKDGNKEERISNPYFGTVTIIDKHGIEKVLSVNDFGKD